MLYDCFTFFNELDLLDIRLHELDAVVDRFVLVESNITFSGKQKPYCFNENKERFRKFLPKIEHIMLDQPTGSTSWENEYFQRDCISRGLPKFPGGQEGDFLLISDIDEIFRASTINELLPVTEEIRLLQDCYCGQLNCYCAGEWSYPVLLPYNNLTRTINEIRQAQTGRKVPNGGWHFSYQGGSKNISKKLASYSHTEYDTPEINNLAQLEVNLKFGKSFLAQLGAGILVPVTDGRFPQYIYENQDKFKHMIYPVNRREYVKYKDLYPQAVADHYFNSQEYEWLYHIVVDYESAISIGGTMPAHTIKFGMENGLVYVDEKTFDKTAYTEKYGSEGIRYLGEEIPEVDFTFIEPSEISRLEKLLPYTKKMIAGFGYDHHDIKKEVDKIIPNIDLIGRIWVCVI